MFKKIILLTLLSGLVNASPLIGDSSTIFKKAEPAIVLIGNEEGFGSGVLISSKGLIITNQHVVNSPLPLTVKAKVLVGGKYVEKEYKDIKVLKVHKAYDLALVKIKDKVRFKYLPIKNSNKATTGSKAFVIGNPDVGNGEALRNSITEGLVSSNERKIENLKYLQISAAINPGNSGGAALDKKGNLIGIVTFKALQADSIGFAVPVTEIANKDFILPENKKSNITKAKELEAKGSEFFDKAQMARDENLKKFLYAVAGYYYRMSLAEAPSNASPYHNVGLMYYKLEKVKAAEAYFKKALELDPNSVNTLHTLGIIYVKDNKVDEAQKLWVKGAFLKGPGAGSCAENASITAFNKKDYITAAYFANLAMKHDKSYNVKKRNDLLNQASQHISEYSLNKIQSKDKPESFSLADLKELKKVDKSKKASEIAQRKKEKMEQIKQAEGFKKKLKELIEANKNAPDEWVNKKIPGTVTDMIPVFGGAYIAITVKDLKKLIIYDTLTAKIIKYFPIQSTNCLMAGANELLLVYYPGTRIFEYYNLEKLERTKAKRLKQEFNITELVMGSQNSSTAFISYSSGTEALDRRLYALLDIYSLRTYPLSSKNKKYSHNRPNRFRNTSYRDRVHFVSDNTMHHIAGWCSSHSPNGYEYVRLDLNKKTFENFYEHSSYGSLTISPEGNYVFSDRGLLIKKEKVVKRFKNSSLVGVLDGNFFLQFIKPKKITLRETFSMTDVNSFELPFELNTSHSSFYKGKLGFSKLIVASTVTNKITVLDNKNQTLYTKPLLPSGMGAAKGNSLLASPGEKWVFDLMLLKGQSAKIEDAPKGVELKKGSLAWSIPQGTSKGTKEILLNVKDADGKENYRIIKLVIN